MPTSIADQIVIDAIAGAQTGARTGSTINVNVDGQQRTIPRPFPSPVDWRDCWIYFLMIDRFNNDASPPRQTWNRYCNVRQGGTFKGVQAQLGYLETLGVKAIWISPVVKNSPPDWNYHGYGAQNFLDLDARFASDGTLPTAEIELTDLVNEAHARGMYVILDIVLNHSAHVFDYVLPSGVTDVFADAGIMNGPLGSEPPIRWIDSAGNARSDWQNTLTPPVGPDDAVWPSEFQDYLFFRRRGETLSDVPDWRGFVPGDFSNMRQLVAEYDASVPGQETVREALGPAPVLNVLIRAYAYLMARYDFDAFRIDTVKYVQPHAVETFGNAMREYAMSIGKANFFTFGEIYDNEQTISEFVGREGGSGDGFGIDAALDFPLFFKLPAIAKGFVDVGALRAIFDERRQREQTLLSSHGEAGLYFVSFADNHDQHERIQNPATPPAQVSLALTVLYTLQGIPALYYGTEQSLQGTVTDTGQPDLNTNESVREALWGKSNAFSTATPMFGTIQRLAQLRMNEPALRYGRLYFRQVSGNGIDFGYSSGSGGLVAFSRVLGDREVVVVANTGSSPFNGKVLIDRDLNRAGASLTVAFSNLGNGGSSVIEHLDANIYDGGQANRATIAAIPVSLGGNEAQILA